MELAGQIRELATRTLRAEFRHIHPSEARVLLFDGGDAPLASFGPALSARAADTLRDLGVELHLGTSVTGVDGEGLTVRDRAGATVRHQAGTVLWAAGVAAPPIAAALAAATGAATDRAGRIGVGPRLTVAGHPEISVIGDLMDRDGLPGVAEVAMQSGLYAGRRIRRRSAGRPTDPAVPVPRPRLGGLPRPRAGRRLGRAGAPRRASPAGWSGCSSTSPSSPATATGWARSSPGR